MLCSVTKRHEGEWKQGGGSEQETEGHMQGTEAIKQHRPTQNKAEAKNAAQGHKPTGTEKINNQALQNPVQARCNTVLALLRAARQIDKVV
jgi:hypothetical protein